MSFWRTYYHLVWATKNRQPQIRPEQERFLFAALAAKAGEVDAHLHEIGAWYDHVHVLISIPPNVAVLDAVQTMQQATVQGLTWSPTFGLLTLGEKQMGIARDYIQKQKQHHTQHSTLAWLEKCDEDVLPKDKSFRRIHEDSLNYHASGSLPF